VPGAVRYPHNKQPSAALAYAAQAEYGKHAHGPVQPAVSARLSRLE